MATAIENEYKFTATGSLDADSLLHRLRTFLDGNGIKYKEKTRHSTDEYFDTPEMFLYENDCSLRRKRSSNSKIKLTAKKPGSRCSGMMSRVETERSSDGSQKDLLSFAKKNYPDYAIDLEPVVLIDTDRYAIDYDDGSEIKLSLDRCIYRSGKDSCQFYEIEVESMDDDLKTDFDDIGILDFIEHDLGFTRTVKSKYTRGVEWISRLN